MGCLERVVIALIGGEGGGWRGVGGREGEGEREGGEAGRETGKADLRMGQMKENTLGTFVAVLTPAPLSISSFTTSSLPVSAATMQGVHPFCADQGVLDWCFCGL